MNVFISYEYYSSVMNTIHTVLPFTHLSHNRTYSEPKLFLLFITPGYLKECHLGTVPFIPLVVLITPPILSKVDEQHHEFSHSQLKQLQY